MLDSIAMKKAVSRTLGKYLDFARRAAGTWTEHDGTRMAASLALYTLLSLAPLVILSVAMASLAFDRVQAQTALVNEVGRMAGTDGANAIRTILEYGKTPKAGGLASALGIATLLIGASSVFGELQSALNKIWEVKPPKNSGLVSFAKSRIFSFAMVLALGFLLVVSLVVSTALSAFSGFFSARFALAAPIVTIATTLISMAGLTALFAVVMKYVPDAETRWRDVFQGALLTALLFTVGKSVLALYLGKAAIGSAYGAAGSLIVLIVWVYYSAMIFYFGAVFTKIRSTAQASSRASAQDKAS
jgi:membrane protein